MSEIAIPSYAKKNSDKIKEALALLPERTIERNTLKPFVQFELMDSLKSKFMAVEFYHDEHADKPGEGVNSFGHYFHSGVIQPNGDVLLCNAIYEWRAVIMEYHSGWYMTILEGMGHRMPNFPVAPVLWGATIAAIDDYRIRSEMVSRATCGVVPDGTDYRDLLKAVHEVHRASAMHTPRHDKPSIVRFTI